MDIRLWELKKDPCFIDLKIQDADKESNLVKENQKMPELEMAQIYK